MFILGDCIGGEESRRLRERIEDVAVLLYGALEVKYEGSSWSESESGY